MSELTNVLDSVRKELGNLDRAMCNGDDGAISESLRNLDELVRAEGGRLPERLRHFLERRSYRKAMEFLDTEGLAGGGAERSSGR